MHPVFASLFRLKNNALDKYLFKAGQSSMNLLGTMSNYIFFANSTEAASV